MKKRLQIFFSIFLLMSFSWQCTARSIIYLNFKLNQKELSETICVNKNKPKSCCAAKCHLAKELKKEDKRQSDSSSSLKDKTEKSELRTGLITFVFAPAADDKQKPIAYSRNLPNRFLTSVFHPPSL